MWKLSQNNEINNDREGKSRQGIKYLGRVINKLLSLGCENNNTGVIKRMDNDDEDWDDEDNSCIFVESFSLLSLS